MTDCIQARLLFPRCRGRWVESNCSGGNVTSKGDVVLLHRADHALGLTEQVARALADWRRRASCRQDTLGIVRQRVYARALWYEDLNNHVKLRPDMALHTGLDKDPTFASASTLCRFWKRTVLDCVFHAKATTNFTSKLPVI